MKATDIFKIHMNYINLGKGVGRSYWLLMSATPVSGYLFIQLYKAIYLLNKYNFEIAMSGMILQIKAPINIICYLKHTYHTYSF